MRSRKRLSFASTLLVTTLAGASAFAQGAPPSRAPSRSSTQFTLRREEAGGADANTARQRARAGDCAGALPAFDAAVRVTIEPTLRRDRGLCHEKLGNAFPAIEDYRAYLVARPDAPDADQIRERLVRLEEAAGVGGPAQVREKDDGFNAGGSASFSANGNGFSASTSGSSSGSVGPRPGEPERSYDYYADRERLLEASGESALRRGTGWVAGAFLLMPRYFANLSGGSSDQLFFGTGLSFRYAFGQTISLVTDLGYNGGLNRGSEAGGFLSFVGVEARFPLDSYASNQIYLGGGIGYENLLASQLAVHNLLARFRLGYRHVFGPSIALEIGADGGPLASFASSGSVTLNDYARLSADGPAQPGRTVGGTSDTQGLLVVSGAVAFVVAF